MSNAEALRSLVLAVQAGDVAQERRALGRLAGSRSEVAREAAGLALLMLDLGFRLGARLGDDGDAARKDALLRVALNEFVQAHSSQRRASLTLV